MGLHGIGTGPINGNMKAATTASLSGLLLKVDGTNTLNLTVAVGNTPLGVTIDSSHKDKDGTLVTGGRVSFMPSGGVLYMRAEAATYVQGQTLYVAATDGFVHNVDAGSATVAGIYVGQGEVVSSAEVTANENLIAVQTNAVAW